MFHTARRALEEDKGEHEVHHHPRRQQPHASFACARLFEDRVDQLRVDDLRQLPQVPGNVNIVG
ncbi:hypothetical protein VXC91_42580 [Streptomyces chiangmaiensis]|uniref:Uncharacterized protein n=1 Tax=Streptomyces chiangmaiensis TaxID=766497 RepID=A0ABU7FW82_9ACTN|nr:hypothetical protein [Streptomyces chiangmaiensis]MED7828375.1 hypothetical protein [Streptomyces chiangmaiensis]